MTLGVRLKNVLRQGCSTNFTEEENRHAVVINLFAITGTFITAALGTRAYIASELALATSLLIAAFVFSTIRVSMVVRKSVSTHRLAAAALILSLMILLAYLVISGGKAHTGPLWIMVLPPVTLFLNGLRNGILLLAVFIATIAFLLFSNAVYFVEVTYSLEFKKRLFYIFVIVTFLSAVYEYSRQQTYKEIQNLRNKFERQACIDPLTDLLNRRGLITQITPELARAERKGASTALILVDIDRFKQLNDTYGHDAGDEALRCAAKTMAQAIRTQDHIARWGGEEFLFVLPDTSVENATVVAEKIRKKLADTVFNAGEQAISITASFGVAKVINQAELSRSISNADKALYQAKESGRNRVVAVN